MEEIQPYVDDTSLLNTFNGFLKEPLFEERDVQYLKKKLKKCGDWPSFLTWFKDIAAIITQLKEIWVNDYIFGYMDRGDTRTLMSGQPIGTFMIRFSDTMGLVLCVVAESGDIEQNVMNVREINQQTPTIIQSLRAYYAIGKGYFPRASTQLKISDQMKKVGYSENNLLSLISTLTLTKEPNLTLSKEPNKDKSVSSWRINIDVELKNTNKETLRMNIDPNTLVVGELIQMASRRLDNIGKLTAYVISGGLRAALDPNGILNDELAEGENIILVEK